MKIISTITEVDLSLTPQDIVYQLKESDYLCFFDSSLVPDKYSKFSYIGWEPAFVIKSWGLKNEFINVAKKITSLSYQHPLKYFKENLNKNVFHLPEDKKANIKILYIKDNEITELALPTKKTGEDLPEFIGGFMGYLSYDLKNYIEELPQSVVDDIHLPLIYQGYYNQLLAYNNLKKQWYYIRNFIVNPSGNPDKKQDKLEDGRTCAVFDQNDLIGPEAGQYEITGRINSDFARLNARLDVKIRNIKSKIIDKYLENQIDSIKLKSNLTRRDYIKGVRKTKDHIYAGDIYQVNFSQRFEAQVSIDPMDLYYILREKNAAPFSAYLGFPELVIGSSSPERFLYQKGDIIETRPIKGTRPRGKNRTEDEKYARDLAGSIKDRAELNMIVDLERNDLGKFCYYGTVEVSEHAMIEKYARVFHSVSTIVGQVKRGIDIADIIRAAFPGGSITGAPKIRAMEIIDKLEPTSRGVYTGAIGYMSIDNTMDLNIVIRTFIIKDGRFYYNVGGGIVADSDPAMEYQETLDKGIALEETLNFFKSRNLHNIKKGDKV